MKMRESKSSTSQDKSKRRVSKMAAQKTVELDRQETNMFMTDNHVVTDKLAERNRLATQKDLNLLRK